MTRDPSPEPNAIPVRAVALMVLICVGVVALGAGVAWVFFPAAREEQNRPPGPVEGIPLEIQPVEVYRVWLERQQALLAGAGGRLPIGAAMAKVVDSGTLDPEGGP